MFYCFFLVFSWVLLGFLDSSLFFLYLSCIFFVILGFSWLFFGFLFIVLVLLSYSWFFLVLLCFSFNIVFLLLFSPLFFCIGIIICTQDLVVFRMKDF